MTCHVCGAVMRPLVTDLPFKVSDSSIVVLKGLPVIQCGNCSEFLIEDPVLARVDAILKNVNTGAELQVVKYAA